LNTLPAIAGLRTASGWVWEDKDREEIFCYLFKEIFQFR